MKQGSKLNYPTFNKSKVNQKSTMKNYKPSQFFGLILLLTCSLYFFTSSHAQNSTGYLFLSKYKLKEIRKAVEQSGSHHQLAFQALKERVDQNNLSVYGSGVNTYNRSYLAREAAFISLISNKPKVKKHYADLAFDTIKSIYENPEQERYPHEGYGLSRAMMGLGLALPYAWCRESWSQQQQQYVNSKIEQALNLWPEYEHANFGDERGSNWVAVCRGGELILLLAAEQKEKWRKRYEFLVEQLLIHMQNGYGNLGTTQEGMGYLEYGGTFLLKAVFAAASAGDSTLYQEAQNHQWWKLSMYAESFQPHFRKFLMTGVAGSSGYDEGWASLQLNLAPETELPYLTWWYDRHMGKFAPGSLQDKFDSDRAGTIWSVLYYPVGLTPKDPTGIYPAGIADDHGYYYFRNRWKDENDILFSIMADEHHHGHAWDQPEVFALNLMAYNTRFVGGPSKERSDDLYSTLLIDNKFNIEHSVRLLGKTVDYKIEKTDGSVLIDGGELYKQLGADDAKRFCRIEFFGQNKALIAFIDSVASDEKHQYSFQLNLGDDNNDDQINSQAVNEEALHTFKLEGRNGNVSGNVVTSDDVTIQIGDPFRININGKSTTLVTVLYLTDEENPEWNVTHNNHLIEIQTKEENLTLDLQSIFKGN